MRLVTTLLAMLRRNSSPTEGTTTVSPNIPAPLCKSVKYSPATSAVGIRIPSHVRRQLQRERFTPIVRTVEYRTSCHLPKPKPGTMVLTYRQRHSPFPKTPVW